ncbi:MAG TPA: GTP cyclohydrolase I, partial [Agromyces sp.]
HVAYLPGEKIVGLGRIPAVVDTIASRPQVQERLTEQIADALEAGLRPRGVLVVLDAEHGCVTARGARQEHSSTVTIASRGALADPVARAEIIALIGSVRGG